MNNLEKFLEERRNASKMLVTPASLAGIEPWAYREIEGGEFEYSRGDGTFFRLAGFEVQADREVPGWKQPMLQENTGPGVIVLVTNGYHYLVSARQEPGNSADKQYTLLGPTLQASKSNLETTHGGKRPPRAELYENEWVNWFNQPGDGGRYYNKTNRLGILSKKRELNEYKGRLLENEFWASHSELLAAFQNGDVNPHLAECLAVASFLL